MKRNTHMPHPLQEEGRKQDTMNITEGTDLEILYTYYNMITIIKYEKNNKIITIV